MNKITKVLLGLIFVLALILRFWRLDVYPEAIDEDEMALGYYAYSLIHNGSDEYGHKFPIYFQSAGDYKYGLYSYIDTIPVFLFGLNPITTRSVSAVAGSLSVIAIFFLAYEIMKKEEYALLSAFVLSINPTHIHFSRVAYNNILGALFAIVSITLYLKWIKGNSFKTLIFSFLSFIAAIYSYQAYRIFLPAVFVLIPIFLFRSLGKVKLTAIIFSTIIVLSVGFSFIPAVSRSRAQDISILINQPLLTEQISEDGLGGSSIFTARLYHNKLVNLTLGAANRYFAYFDPRFLFTETSAETQRHSTPGVGLLYLIDAIFLVLGLIYLAKFVEGGYKFIPLILLLSAPLPAIVVVESVSTTRAVIITLGYTLLISLGMFALLEINKKYKRFILLVMVAAVLANFSYFFHQYTINKIYHHPWYSDVGLKEMVEDVNRLEGGYKAIVMSHGHYIPYLFYNKVRPQDFIASSDFIANLPAGGVPVARYGKIYFNMPSECPEAGNRNVLYICFGYKVPAAAKLIDVISYKDGQPALTLVEFVGMRASPENLPERVEYSRDKDIRFPEGILPDNYETFWPVQP